MMDRLGVALLAVVFAASPASAQTDSLQEIEDLLASGRFTSARSALDRWLDQHKPGGTNASAEERAHALFLSGRLTTDVEESEEKYRAVVLSYPSSPFAPKALLLLGQGLAARGENERAEAQLRRVATDYPASTERATAMLWIARLQGAANDWPAACETVRQAMTTRSAGREVVALLRSEEETACNRPAPRQTPAPPRDAGFETIAVDDVRRER